MVFLIQKEGKEDDKRRNDHARRIFQKDGNHVEVLDSTISFNSDRHFERVVLIMARTKKVAETSQNEPKTKVLKKAPKHESSTFMNKYANMLEDLVFNNQLQMIQTIANRIEFVESGQIYSVLNYRNEMAQYVEKYGYAMMNEFCKAYRKRQLELMKEKKEGEE